MKEENLTQMKAELVLPWSLDHGRRIGVLMAEWRLALKKVDPSRSCFLKPAVLQVLAFREKVAKRPYWPSAYLCAGNQVTMMVWRDWQSCWNSCGNARREIEEKGELEDKAVKVDEFSYFSAASYLVGRHTALSSFAFPAEVWSTKEGGTSIYDVFLDVLIFCVCNWEHWTYWLGKWLQFCSSGCVFYMH